MSREVTESVKIIIKTDDGHRLELQSKGSAPRGMLSAFGCLPAKRREWMLKHMQAEHEKLLAKEAERALEDMGATIANATGTGVKS